MTICLLKRTWISSPASTARRVKQEQTGHLLEFVVSEPQRAADLLRERGDRWRVSLFGDRLHVITEKSVEEGMADTRRKLEAAGISVISAEEGRYSLEDV